MTERNRELMAWLANGEMRENNPDLLPNVNRAIRVEDHAAHVEQVHAGSDLEAAMFRQIRDAGLPLPVPEHRFHHERRWRFDFAWEWNGRQVALEVEGGVWSGGRHVRGQGFINDAEKYNEAALLGWTVLRVTREHIESGEALAWLQQALEAT